MFNLDIYGPRWLAYALYNTAPPHDRKIGGDGFPRD